MTAKGASGAAEAKGARLRHRSPPEKPAANPVSKAAVTAMTTRDHGTPPQGVTVGHDAGVGASDASSRASRHEHAPHTRDGHAGHAGHAGAAGCGPHVNDGQDVDEVQVTTPSAASSARRVPAPAASSIHINRLSRRFREGGGRRRLLYLLEDYGALYQPHAPPRWWVRARPPR